MTPRDPLAMLIGLLTVIILAGAAVLVVVEVGRRFGC